MTSLAKRKPKPPEPSEAGIQAAILNHLNALGHRAWRINTMGVPLHAKDGSGRVHWRPGPNRGVPDIICVLKDGTFFACEVKRHGGKVSIEQHLFLEDVRARNGIAIVAYSVDDVILELQKHDRSQQAL